MDLVLQEITKQTILVENRKSQGKKERDTKRLNRWATRNIKECPKGSSQSGLIQGTFRSGLELRIWVGRGSGKLEQARALQTGNSLDQVASLAWIRTLPGDPCQKKMLTEPSRARLCPKWGPTPRKGARAKIGNCSQKPSHRTGRAATLWAWGFFYKQVKSTRGNPRSHPSTSTSSPNSRWLQEGSEPTRSISGEP